MADSLLRESQRSAQETGSIHDLAAHLQARLRAGDLDRTRLQFAARLGHPAAKLLVDDLAVAEIITDSQLSPYTASSWGWRIRREDREALLVVAETVARYPLDPFRGRPGAKPGTVTYVRFLMRHLSRRVDRDEVTEAIRRDLLAWALG